MCTHKEMRWFGQPHRSGKHQSSSHWQIDKYASGPYNLQGMDYMKLVDLIARILGSEHNELKARHDRVDIIEISMTLADGKTLPYRMFPTRYETDLVFSKKNLTPDQFKLLTAKLEFEAEQIFMKNVRISVDDEIADYKIKLAV